MYILLVLCLGDQPFAGIIYEMLAHMTGRSNTTPTVGFPLATTTVFNLETREISVRLDLLDKWHLEDLGQWSGAHQKSISSIHPLPTKLRKESVPHPVGDTEQTSRKDCMRSP